MTIGFTGCRIERADQIRVDADQVRAAMGSLSARLLLLEGLDPVSDGADGLAWGMLSDAHPDADLVFLGLEDGKPRFVALLPDGVRADPRSHSAWRILPFLRPDQAALYALARSLVDWHARHRFCANCGAPTRPAKGGWQRTCGTCRAEHFPRTDPVGIMLAVHEDAVLVGRQPGFPPGRYSALAGFIEPGETIEEAVARELYEEAGIRVDQVRYVASQPWPFPSQLMIACLARSQSRELTLDTTEIEDAFWVTRDEVRASLNGDPDAKFVAPPPFAIAHSLLKHWLENGDPYAA
jgi:NAD+ diphosphatase